MPSTKAATLATAKFECARLTLTGKNILETGGTVAASKEQDLNDHCLHLDTKIRTRYFLQ
jgi:hypothetical protein